MNGGEIRMSVDECKAVYNIYHIPMETESEDFSIQQLLDLAWRFDLATATTSYRQLPL